MQKRLLLGAVVLAATLFISGCATLISGTSQKVSVTATPAATVVVTSLSGLNYYYGTTPATIDLPRSHTYTVTVQLPGYKPKIINVHQTLNPLFLVSWIGGFVIGGFIDMADGAMWSLRPSRMTVKLETAMNDGAAGAAVIAQISSPWGGVQTIRTQLTPAG